LRHEGGCHCGKVRVVLESEIDPRQIKVRACQCSFCRKHGARAVSDPDGLLSIQITDEASLLRYEFAHRTAEFLLCSDCGVYVAAVTNGPGETRAIAQLNTFTNNQFFGVAVAVDYGDETPAERIDRRHKVWMPVSIEVLGEEPSELIAS
jgi:hypothetical protein